MAWLDIKGHEDIIRFLVNATRKDRLAHSLLFIGPEGIGKMMLAKEFAKFILCDDPRDEGACDQCRNCKQCRAFTHPDLHIISQSSLDWIKIDQIRIFQEQMALLPFANKRKIFIIDNVGMLTEEAANSLLKFMEEPPIKTLLILITDQIDSCPPTLISRCQQLYFSPLTFQETERALGELTDSDKEFSHFLARFSEGRLGRAISLAKETNILEDKNRLLHNLIDNNLNSVDLVANLNRENLERLIEFMLLFFRDTLLLKTGLGREFLVNSDEADTLLALSERLRTCDIQDLLEDILQAQELNKTNVNSKILFRWLMDKIGQRLGSSYV